MNNVNVCEYHIQLVEDIAVIKNDLKYMRDKVCSHIEEGEKAGGFRDQVLLARVDINNLKEQISVIKKGYWKTAIVGGLVGGLMANTTPEMINFIVGWFK